jgi:O-antigen/teichoic acid export membrane protein
VSESRNDLTSQTLSGMFWTAGAGGANALLKMVVLVVLTRLLTPADFGVVGAALIIVGFSEIFSQLGLGPALVQRQELEPRHTQTAFVASLVFGLLLGGLVWALAPYLATFFRIAGSVDVLRALAWLFPLHSVAIVAGCLVQRDHRFRWLAHRDVVSYGLGYGLVGIALALAGWGVWALVAAQLAQAAVQALMLIPVHPPSWRPLPSWRAFRELLDFGAGQTAARVASFLANQGDNIVVGRALGPVALGVYTRAYQLMAVPATLFGNALDRVLFPTLARVQDDEARLAGAYLRAVAWIALVMLPAGVVFAVLAHEIITVVLGAQWGEVVGPFQVFAIALLFRTSYKMSDALARATGAMYRRAWRQALYAALVFGGAWVGSHWGIVGVALGVLGSLAVNFFLMAHLSLTLANVTWRRFGQAHLPAMLCAALAGTLALFSITILRHNVASPALRLFGAILFTATGLALALWRTPRPLLGQDGLHIVGLLRGLVHSRVISPLRARR